LASINAAICYSKETNITAEIAGILNILNIPILTSDIIDLLVSDKRYFTSDFASKFLHPASFIALDFDFNKPRLPMNVDVVMLINKLREKLPKDKDT
jgi:predicted nucleotide-binding protein (sugar kinase/HSP70/actin superfamily)